MKKLLVFALFAAFAGFAWLSLPSPDRAGQTAGGAQQVASGSGVVQAIDRDRGTVTIQHEALPALNMMAMTMAYAVKDRSLIANLRPSQKVEFQLARDGGDYLITEIK